MPEGPGASGRGAPPGDPAGAADHRLGRVVGLWRYPVKSMAGEGLERAEATWQGLEGDRRWAFVRDGVLTSDFPWMTIRQRPTMCRYRPRFVDPQRPDASAVAVLTPDGEDLDVADPALAAGLGPGVRPIKQNRGVFDAMPISLISVESVAAIGAIVGRAIDPRRFRPNLLVDTGGGEPFAEDEWVGSTLRIGAAAVRLDKRDQRCAVVNVDPDSAGRDPAVLRSIGAERGGYLGVYGSMVDPGAIGVGDPVSIDAGAGGGAS